MMQPPAYVMAKEIVILPFGVMVIVCPLQPPPVDIMPLSLCNASDSHLNLPDPLSLAFRR